MDFYQVNLGVLVATNAYLLWSQYRTTKKDEALTLLDPALEERGEKIEGGSSGSARRFQLNFFIPYALAVAADWLQVSRIIPVVPVHFCDRRADACCAFLPGTGSAYLRHLQV